MKNQKVRKIISFISCFSLLSQTFLPLTFAMPVYAEGDATDSAVVEVTPTPEITPEATPSPESTPEVTVTPEITPDVTPDPTPTVILTPTIEITPEVTVTPEIAPEATPTEQPHQEEVQNNSPPAETPLQPAPVTTLPKEITQIAELEQVLTPEISPTLTTDKTDYFPTDTVYITGVNFLPGTTYTLKITSNDYPVFNITPSVTSDENGNLAYSFRLDGNYRPNYKIEALDNEDTIVTHYDFLDSSNLQGINAGTQSPNPVSLGSVATFPITFSKNGSGPLSITLSVISGLPTGSSASFNPNPVDVNGNSTLTISTTGSAPGTYSFTIRAVGDSTKTVNKSLIISKAEQSALIITGLPANATYGQTGILAATSGGSGTGAVTYNASSSTACSINSITGTVSIINGTGTCSITATKATDTNYNSVTSLPVSITIGKATSTTTVSCPTTSQTYTGSALTPCTVSVTGVGGLNLTPIPLYTNNINLGTATAGYIFAGDSNYTGSGDSKTFQIVLNPNCTSGVLNGDGVSTTVQVVLSCSNVAKFASSGTTTADATDLNKIKWDAIDNHRPSTAIINGNTITLTFNAVDGTISQDINIDAGTLSNSSNITNSAISVLAASITDNAKPIVWTSAISTPQLSNLPTGFGITISDTEAGNLSYGGGCTTDNTTIGWTNLSTFLKWGGNTNFPDGVYDSCTIILTDGHGNFGTTTIPTFIVDTTGPATGTISISPLYNNGGVNYISGLSTISAPISDSGSGVNESTCQWSGDGGNNLGSGLVSYTGGVCLFTGASTSGATGITVRAQDNVGRWGSFGTVVPVTLDITAPNSSITSPTDSALVSGTIAISANASDVGSGVAKVEFYHSSQVGEKIGEDTSAPYTVEWNSASVPSGIHQLWVFAYDNLGNWLSSSSISVNVNNDSTPPVITPHVSPTPNVYGYNSSDVTVTWTVSDPESTISSSTGCETTVISDETTGQTITCTATSAGGTDSHSVTVKLDKTGPSASLLVTAGTLGSNGWYTSDITIRTICSDSISPITAYSGDYQYQTENTSGQIFNAWCENRAGFVTNSSPLTVKLDKTAPTVGTITISPNALNGVLYVGPLSVVSAPVSDLGGSEIDSTSCSYSINNGAGAFISVASAYDSVNNKCVFPNINTSVASGIAISVNDNAGNFFNTTSSWITGFTVDSTNPTGSTTITNTYYGPNSYNLSNTINGIANDTGSGVDKIEMSILTNSGAGNPAWFVGCWRGWQWAAGCGILEPLTQATYSSVDHTWTYGGLPIDYLTSGISYQVYPIIYDKVGNSVTGTFDQFTWDDQKPSSEVSALFANINTRTFNVSYIESDPLSPSWAYSEHSGIKNVDLYYRLNGGSWTLYGTYTSSPISFTATTDGRYDFYTVARDNAENVEDTPVSFDSYTVVDTGLPTVVSVDSDGDIYNLATVSPHTIKVTFSEEIANTPYINVHSNTVGTQTVTSCGDSDLTTFCFDYPIPATNQETHSIYISEAQDTAGNEMILNNSHTFTVDTLAPSIIDVSSTTTNGTYGVGTVILVTVQFSQPVTVVNPAPSCHIWTPWNGCEDWTYFSPFLTLETGTTDRSINYESGSGTNTLTFSYTVQAGDTSTDLDYQSITSLQSNGGTIKDSNGNSASLTLAIPGAASSLSHNKNIVIDTAAPTATVSYNITTPTNTDVVATLNNISEPITITNAGGLTSHTFIANGTYTFTFVDAAGNPGSATATVSNIDKTTPTVTLILPTPNNGLLTNYNTQFFSAEVSEPVTSCTLNFNGNYAERQITNGLSDGDGFSNVTSGDDTATNYTLPFLFPFYGNSYGDLSISTNSLMDFGSTNNASYPGSVSELSHTIGISTLWTDLVTTITARVQADNVRFRWTGYGWSSGGSLVNEAVLRSNGNIELHYGDVNLPGRTVTVGISSGNGTSYVLSSINGRSVITPVSFAYSQGASASYPMTRNTDGTYSVVVPGIADGVVNYSVICQDLATNEGTSQSRTLTIDTTPPVLSSKTTFDGWYNSNQTSVFTYSDTNGIASGGDVSCVINTEGTGQTCSVTPNVCDNANNCNSEMVTSNGANIDKFAPTLSANPAAGDYTSSQLVSLIGSDLGSGIRDIYYTLDGTTPDETSTLFVSGTPIVVDTDITINAIAYDNLDTPSDILVASYRIVPVTSSSSDGGSGGSATPPVCNDTKPSSAPRLLSAVSGLNSVTLTWSAASSPVSYYLVTYGTTSGVQQYGNPNVGGSGTTSYTVSGLSGGKSYYFKVRAGNGCMPGDFSNEVSATPGGGFVQTPAENFEPGIMGTSTDAIPTATPTIGENQGILGKSTDNRSYWWLLLLFPLSFSGWLVLKKK